MRARAQAAVDGAGGMLEDAGRGGAGAGGFIDVFCPLGDRRAFQKRHLLVQHAVVSRTLQIVRAGKGQPQQVVREMRAHPRPARRVPPVLHITGFKLARRTQHDLRAQGVRPRPGQGHGVLQLVAVAGGAACLIKAGLGMQARCHRLVEQPAIDQHIKQRIGRAHLGGTEQRIPVLYARIFTRGGAHGHGLMDQRKCRRFGGCVAHQVHTLERRPGPQRDHARQGRARVQPKPAALPQLQGHHQVALGIEELTAVAGPVQAVVGTVVRAWPDRGLAEKGRATAKARGRLGLRAQQAQQAATRQRRKAWCGGQRGAVAALFAHHPLHHANEAQVLAPGAQVAHLHMHLLDGGDGIDTPAHHHVQRAPAVADGGGALGMLHAIHRIGCAPGRWRQAPHFARAAVLQQQPFGGRVGHRVVGPCRKLVEAAVERPGVARAAFGHQRSQLGIGQHIDPRFGGPQPLRHIKPEGAGDRCETAHRRGYGCAGLVRGNLVGGATAPGAGHGHTVGGHPGLHLVNERMTIGLQGDAGQAGQSAQLLCRQLIEPQHMQTGDHRAREGVQAGVVVLAQQGELALQGNVVGVGFIVQHHHVTGHTAMRPFAQGLGQRAQQAQALARSGHDQHQWPVAGNSELPQHAAVAHAMGCHGCGEHARVCRIHLGQRQHQCRGQGLDCGQVVAVRALRRPLDAGQRGRHGRSPLHIGGLAVFIDDGQQCGRVWRSCRGKGDASMRAGRNAQHHAQGGHGVQARVQRGRRLGHAGHPRQRLAGRVVTPQPEPPVGLATQAQHIPVCTGHKVRSLQRGFSLQAGGAHKPQCLLCGQPLGRDEEVGERRVRLVGRVGGQGNVEGRDQLQLDHFVAQVAHHHLAQFDVVFRAHPHGGVHLEPWPQRVKTYAVGVEDAAVHRAHIGRGVAGDRRRHAGAHLPHVKKAAVRVAQGIVAPAADAGLVPAAPARTVGAQRDAVSPVAEQVGGLQRLGAWRYGAHMVGRFLLARVQRQARWRSQQGG